MEEIDWAKALRNKDGTTRRNASDMSVLLFFSGAQHGSFVRKGCLLTILRFRGKCCLLRVWFSWLANKVWIGCTSLRRCHVMLSYTLNGPSQRWSFNIFQPNFFKVSTNWRCTKHIYAIWIQPLSASWRQIQIIIFIWLAWKVCWVFGWMNLIWTVYLLEPIKRCCSWTCWLSFYLSAVFTPGFGVRNRMEDAAAVFTGPQEWCSMVCCVGKHIHGSIHPFHPGFLTPWQKHQKLAGPSTKWWKD